MNGFIDIILFTITWRNVSSIEARAIVRSYVVDDGEDKSGFQMRSLIGKGGSSSTKSIHSDLMRSKAENIAVCLSKLL